MCGMIQACDGARFLLKTFGKLRIFGEMLWQNFDGYAPVQTRIIGQVNLSHPAGSQLSGDFIGSESSTWRDGHGS